MHGCPAKVGRLWLQAAADMRYEEEIRSSAQTLLLSGIMYDVPLSLS